MKKKILLFLYLVISTSLFCIEFNLVESDDFNFYFTGTNNEITSRIIEFNTLLENKLQLRNNHAKRNIYIFSNKTKYNEYLSELEIENRDDFIYVTFSKIENNRLIIFLEHPDFTSSLKYHLTLQYINHYGKDAPEWYKKGLASYMEESGLFNSNKENNINWGIFYYLFNCENSNDKRILWDSLSFLKWSNEKNKDNTIDAIFHENNIKAKATKYIREFETYDDKLQKGIKSYNTNEYTIALKIFNSLLENNNNEYTLHYYKGLSLSSLGNFNKAYSSFSHALDLGAPKDITYYSIAVNFYNSGNKKDTKKYLNKITEDSDVFNSVTQLLKQLNK